MDRDSEDYHNRNINHACEQSAISASMYTEACMASRCSVEKLNAKKISEKLNRANQAGKGGRSSRNHPLTDLQTLERWSYSREQCNDEFIRMFFKI